MDRLCRDEDPNVRLIIAEGTLLDEEILHILADDENPYVQGRAKRGLEVCEMEKNSTHHSHMSLVTKQGWENYSPQPT